MRKLRDYKYFLQQIRDSKARRASCFVIFFRYLIWIFRYRSFSDFFILKQYEKENRMESILSLHEFLKIHERLNPLTYRRILEDKYIFDRYFSSFGFPLAKMQGYIANERVHFTNGKTLPLDEILQCRIDCFMKSATKWGGMAVHKLQISDGKIYLDNKPSDLKVLASLIKGDLYVIQNTVVQHPDLNRLCSSSVNTIRMVTIHNGDESSNFFSYLRMGVGGSLVDNITHGGLGCGINDDGTLYAHAINNTGIFEVEHHPSSGIAFKGYSVPFYRESLELVKRMHNSIYCMFIIGWDVAITADGPVIIEGNPVAGLMFEQAIFGGMRDKFFSNAIQYEAKRGYLK